MSCTCKTLRSGNVSRSARFAVVGLLATVRCSTLRPMVRFEPGKNQGQFIATVTPFLARRTRQPNPSIERTFQRLLRTLWLAAHVER